MGPVQAALRELVGLSATGALHVEAGLGAVLYLQNGQVVHIDAAASPGIGRVLLASGRLAESVWGAAVNAGAPLGRVGALLVEEGHLSQGELELSVTGALHDAAFFALNVEPTSVRFASGEAPWFGSPLAVPVEHVIREAERRRELLTTALPSAAYDNVPFVPVARLPRAQVVLDGFRWELIVSSDGHRTPLELARLLGRGAYATLLETRRLAAAGLLRLPAYGPEPSPPPLAVVPDAVTAPDEPPEPELPPLPRRRVGGRRRNGNQQAEAKGADESRWPTPPPEVRTEPPTISMLARFRDALEGLR